MELGSREKQSVSPQPQALKTILIIFQKIYSQEKTTKEFKTQGRPKMMYVVDCKQGYVELSILDHVKH